MTELEAYTRTGQHSPTQGELMPQYMLVLHENLAAFANVSPDDQETEQNTSRDAQGPHHSAMGRTGE